MRCTLIVTSCSTEREKDSHLLSNFSNLTFDWWFAGGNSARSLKRFLTNSTLAVCQKNRPRLGPGLQVDWRRLWGGPKVSEKIKTYWLSILVRARPRHRVWEREIRWFLSSSVFTVWDKERANSEQFLCWRLIFLTQQMLSLNSSRFLLAIYFNTQVFRHPPFHGQWYY